MGGLPAALRPGAQLPGQDRLVRDNWEVIGRVLEAAGGEAHGQVKLCRLADSEDLLADSSGFTLLKDCF